VWLDGMEISQFTYFQQIAGRDLFPVSVELTYGLERLAMYIQNVDDYRDLRYSSSVNYGDIFYTREKECSEHSFNAADTGLLFKLFSAHEAESQALNAKGLVFPAYDELLKCSHYFNLLDARGVISVTERAAYIGRIRDLARECATVYLKKYEEKQDESQTL
jgi:glycyl-tRNA synthetase alpha chain